MHRFLFLFIEAKFQVSVELLVFFTFFKSEFKLIPFLIFIYDFITFQSKKACILLKYYIISHTADNKQGTDCNNCSRSDGTLNNLHGIHACCAVITVNIYLISPTCN